MAQSAAVIGRRTIAYTWLLGVGSMVGAGFCVTVTVAGNDYLGVLRLGLLFAAVSAILLAFVSVRGGWRWRVTVVISALPLLFVVAMLGIRYPFESRFERAQAHLEIHRAQLSQAVLDVTSANLPGSLISGSALPLALQAPGVTTAIVGEFCVSLILYRNPDTVSGLRVWVGEPGPEYADRPTQMHGVTRYSYCNDFPKSPSNRPY